MEGGGWMAIADIHYGLGTYNRQTKPRGAGMNLPVPPYLDTRRVRTLEAKR
jgi:hypothetical protein